MNIFEMEIFKQKVDRFLHIPIKLPSCSMEVCGAVIVASIFIYLYSIKAVITMVPVMNMIHSKSGCILNFVEIEPYAALAQSLIQFIETNLFHKLMRASKNISIRTCIDMPRSSRWFHIARCIWLDNLASD